MLEQMGIAAKQASYKLAQLSSREKNRVLEKIADELEAQSEIILNANAQDVADARANGLSEAMLDRLALTPARLKGIADDVRQVCNLADPVGQVIDGGVLDSGLRLERRRVPLGVIGVIYEARPNVTVDVASLCLKTGNAVILRGGKETCRTNAATVAVIQDALKSCGLPAGAVQAIDNPDRALVSEMLRMDKYIDMLIPRGGAGLHKLCRSDSIVLIDYRNDIVIEQRSQGVAGVQEAFTVFHISTGQQHLPDVNAINRKQLFPQLNQSTLPYRRQQLFRGDGRWQFRVTQVLTSGGDRARRHNNNPMPGGM